MLLLFVTSSLLKMCIAFRWFIVLTSWFSTLIHSLDEIPSNELVLISLCVRIFSEPKKVNKTQMNERNKNEYGNREGICQLNIVAAWGDYWLWCERCRADEISTIRWAWGQTNTCANTLHYISWYVHVHLHFILLASSINRKKQNLHSKDVETTDTLQIWRYMNTL